MSCVTDWITAAGTIASPFVTFIFYRQLVANDNARTAHDNERFVREKREIDEAKRQAELIRIAQNEFSVRQKLRKEIETLNSFSADTHVDIIQRLGNSHPEHRKLLADEYREIIKAYKLDAARTFALTLEELEKREPGAWDFED